MIYKFIKELVVLFLGLLGYVITLTIAALALIWIRILKHVPTWYISDHLITALYTYFIFLPSLLLTTIGYFRLWGIELLGGDL